MTSADLLDPSLAIALKVKADRLAIASPNLRLDPMVEFTASPPRWALPRRRRW